MNTTVAEGVELAKAVVEASAEVPADVKLIIAPPSSRQCRRLEKDPQQEQA